MLAFCNNIGPVYFTGFVLHLFPVERPLIFLAGMYLLPFLYGLVLRYTLYRDIPMRAFLPSSAPSGRAKPFGRKKRASCSLHFPGISGSRQGSVFAGGNTEFHRVCPMLHRLFGGIYDSVQSSESDSRHPASQQADEAGNTAGLCPGNHQRAVTPSPFRLSGDTCFCP